MSRLAKARWAQAGSLDDCTRCSQGRQGGPARITHMAGLAPRGFAGAYGRAFAL